MRTVWKYVVPVSAFEYAVRMPRDAKIVHVGGQGGDVSNVCFWAQLDLAADGCPAWEESLRTFAAVGTGHRVPEGYAYVGTAVVDPLVWHLYEKLS